MRNHWGRILVAAGITIAGTAAQAQVTPFVTSGGNAAAIQTTVDNFRSVLGTNNGVGGSFASGRREVNWDGVPSNFADPNLIPDNFFNINSPRGLDYTTPGSGFVVSDNATGGNGRPLRFGFPDDFTAFSGQKVFTPLNSVITDVHFFIPGTSIPATVTGFGAVFTDVEIANVSGIQFFSANGSLITSIDAPTSANGGFSFVGATSTVPIFSVRITTGNQIIISNGNLGAGEDAVVLDDFIYAEPTALAAAPEPSALALFAIPAVGGLCTILRRRKR